MLDETCILPKTDATRRPYVIDELEDFPRAAAPPQRPRRRLVVAPDSDEDLPAPVAQARATSSSGQSAADSASLASHNVNSTRLQSLVSMGFLAGPARHALQTAKGNVDMAIDICLRSSCPQPLSAPTGEKREGKKSAPLSSASHVGGQIAKKSSTASPKESAKRRRQKAKSNDDWIVENASSPSSCSGESEDFMFSTDEERSEAPKKKVRKASASRRAPRLVMLRKPDSDSDDGSDVSIASGRKRKRGATVAFREVSAIAQNLLLDALSGSATDGEPLGAMRKRRVDVRKSISRGHTNLRVDFSPSSDDLVAKCKSFSELRSHQKVGVRWLLALHSKVPGMILADEMGLGKTAQTLCFLQVLASPRPSLVVAPASLLTTWETEAARWTPALRTLKYHSSTDAKRLDAQETFFQDPAGYQIIITTPQAFHNKDNRKYFFQRVSFEYLIVDEAHSLKNSGTHRYQEISRHAKCNARLLLTGTPIQNSLSELATLLGFALSDGNKSRVTEELRAIAEEPLEKALQQMQNAAAPLILRRLKSDVLSELPRKHGEIVYCEMTDLQRKLYEEEMQHSRRLHKGGTRLTTGAVKDCFHRLRRVCLHPLLARRRLSQAQKAKLVQELKTKRPDFAKASELRCLQEVEQWTDYDKHFVAIEHGLSEEFRATENELLENGKAKELLKILNKQAENNCKTLVFSQFTQLLDIFETVLKVSNIAYSRFDGKTAIDDRASVVSEFQKEGGPLVFLISTKAGGVGLNLTAANVVVMLDLDFNPQNSRQAEDRVHRLGQSSEVTVYYLICKGSVEEMVLSRNLAKMRLDQHFGAKKGTLEVASDVAEVEAVEDVVDEDDETNTHTKQCEKDVMQELRAQLTRSS